MEAMVRFSCPHCFQVIDYIPVPGYRIVWVEKHKEPYLITSEEMLRLAAKDLEKELDISPIKGILIDCPYCRGRIRVFLAPKSLKNDTSQIDPDDFSIEI